MRLDHLGHASWLVEAAGLRLLFDPVLGPTHHGGVFEAWPSRSIDEAALAPDLVLVSHAHADHFDVPSLARVLARDPFVVVVTPDPLVAWAARALGARDVREVGPGQRVELDGVVLVTTPSLEPREWGALVATREAAVWNGVDASHASPVALREVLARALEAAGRGSLELALVRWQPLLELASALAGARAFPLSDYDAELRLAAATGAGALVPSAHGARHAPAFAAMNAAVYPVTLARALSDLALVAPHARVLEPVVGGRYELAGGQVALDARPPRPLAVAHEDPHATDPGLGFDPFARARVAPAPWRDGDLDVVCAFVEGPLARGVERAKLAVGTALELVVEGPAHEERFSLSVRGDGLRVTRGAHALERFDQRVFIDGAMLAAVVRGERAWSEPLLSGGLRVDDRAYCGRPGGLTRPALPAVFTYLGLGYRESERRATEHAVARALATRGAA